MEHRSLAYANYWRNSLADAALGLGGLSSKDVKGFLRLRGGERLSGRVHSDIVEACFAGEPERVQAVAVVIRPWAWFARVEHGQVRRNRRPDVVTPIVTPGVLARDGRLYPSGSTRIPRDLLEPLERGSYAIGSVSDLDTFLTTDHVAGVEAMGAGAAGADADSFETQWQSYLAACRSMLDEVCDGGPGRDAAFEEADHGYLVKKASAVGSRMHILALFDHLREHAPQAPLFDRFASEAVQAPELCLAPGTAFSSRLGHASDVYPLAAAQRDALTHWLAVRHGEMLAVNGPPGTGKTTLLLSVVATLWARAAIQGTEPPVIVAASTNNQAVTNVIDAFGKDFATGTGPFAGRWLPEVKSFGAYLPSAGIEAKTSGKYQTRQFFESIESRDYVARAQERYLACAAKAYALPTPSVQGVVTALQQGLQREAGKLMAIESAWDALGQARLELHAELGDDPARAQAEREQRAAITDAETIALEQVAERYDGYLAQEPLYLSLLRWLPPVANKRLRLARQFLKQWPGAIAVQEAHSAAQIEDALRAGIGRHREMARTQRESVRRGESAMRMVQERLAQWAAAAQALGGGAGPFESMTLADADVLADKVIRFQIFLLTTHYWEGRWLLDMQELLPKLGEEKRKRGRAALEKRWRRRMKLTPCAVSTLYMLPAELKSSRHDGQGFVDDYLYDFVDLLIIDEAGQVLPEVAGASFALAKTALVIGDTLQLEPIWSIPGHVDKGNLMGAGLLEGPDHDVAHETLSALGKTVAAGCAMRIAQCASRWHYDTALARGMFLYEHRRCFDEIIRYCNSLSYHGKLVPKRGAKADAGGPGDAAMDGLPAMGYLHVDGICTQAGSSRENLLEAEVIAAWLAANRDGLEKAYGQQLEDIVGVVTPFGAQVKAVALACAKVDIAVGDEPSEMTVGTVHSLQGAERPLIIFSAVYSKHADGEFIDRRASMLNVAVSRAKNTFLVFGDMDVFELVAAGKPRGLLAARLFGNDANALSFPDMPRRDLATSRTGFRQLRDAQEHDAFLADLLSRAVHEVHIVSPWIRLACIEETGAMQAMAAAVRRNVRVVVYTDQGSNTAHPDASVREERRIQLHAAMGVLRAHRIEAVLLSKVHSKIVMGDADVYCVGSFNWFSAVRAAEGARHETSLVYTGPDLAAEIQAMKSSLQRRTGLAF